MGEADVIVVGAGVAGLAAAAFLRRAGRSCLLLEAGARIGGRAHTTLAGGAPFDHGASWLHAAGRNPLVALAGDETLINSDAARDWRGVVDGRPATAADRAARDAAWDRLAREAEPLLPDPGASLADAVDRMADDPWAGTIEAWEGPVIAAADAPALSLRDWHANQLEGANLRVAGGLGAFVARRLAGPVELRTPATRVRWGGSRVRVDTPRGTAAAAACVVTVSTGVLAAGALAFDPPLPARVQGAAHDLPMGLLNKVALRAAGADRLDLPPDCSLHRRFRRGEPAMVFLAWEGGTDRVVGFIGGDAARALEAEGGGEAFARAELRRLCGERADQALAPGATVTAWAADPLFRGAYAYARPGADGARAALAEPLAGGRLVLAGEATRTDGLAGTVGGAWLSGRNAARAVLDARGHGSDAAAAAAERR